MFFSCGPKKFSLAFWDHSFILKCFRSYFSIHSPYISSFVIFKIEMQINRFYLKIIQKMMLLLLLIRWESNQTNVLTNLHISNNNLWFFKICWIDYKPNWHHWFYIRWLNLQLMIFLVPLWGILCYLNIHSFLYILF